MMGARKWWLTVPLTVAMVAGTWGAGGAAATSVVETDAKFAMETGGARERASPIVESAYNLSNEVVRTNISSLSDIPDFSGVHPRLFVPPGGLDELRQKVLTNPEFAAEWHLIRQSGDQALSKAFQYLIAGDAELGRQAVAQAIAELSALDDATVASRGRTFLSVYTIAPMIYDWCYDLMTPAQRTTFKDQMKRVFEHHAPKYPIDMSSMSITGHDVEGWFWNQFLVGLAIYDEEPRMWNDALTFFFKEHQPVRNWYFPSGLHPQGWYIGTRFSHVSHFNLLMRQLTGGHVFDSTAHEVPYQLLYYLRPDGQQLRSGDVGGDSTGREEFKASILSNTANLYDDGYLRYAQRFFSNRDPLFETIVDVLTRPAGLEERRLDTLPLVKYHPEPMGSEMIARSGWDASGPDSDDYLVQMRIGEYWFGNHQHMDMGTFQIYYKGNLTGDSGAYRSTGGNSSTDHDLQYYGSTIAHNGLIIYNPNQIGGSQPHDPQPDGGIRFPRKWDSAETPDVGTGTPGDSQPRNLNALVDPRHMNSAANVLAHGTDERDGDYRYAYISGDLTRGYTHVFDWQNPDRAEKVTRSMVTMPTGEADHPLAFFVFDRMRATDESYLKKFVMHLAETPSVEGRRVEASADRKAQGYDGRLVSWSLLPKNPVFDVVEGYKVGYGANEREYPMENVEGGDAFEHLDVRLEVSDADAGKEAYFLHAMTVTEDGKPVEAEAELIESGNVVGAKLFGKNVLFSRTGTLSTEVKFELTGEGTQGVLVTDLVEGAYTIDRTDLELGSFLKLETADAECRCLYFEGGPGSYVVSRTTMTEEIASILVAESKGDTTAPEVALSTDGGVVSGTVAVGATAMDDVGVAGVQLLLNGKRLGEELTSAPYVLAWDTTEMPDGMYSIAAVARDAAGHVGKAEAVNVTVHNEPGFLPIEEDFAASTTGFAALSGGGDWRLRDGYYELASPGSGNLAAHERALPPGDAYRLEVELQTFAIPNGSRESFVAFDVQDRDNYYFASFSEDASKSGVYRMADGEATLLRPLGKAIVPGKKHRAVIERIGGAIDVYLDGSFAAQAFDETFAGGRIGAGSASDALRLYRVKASPLLDGSPRDLEPPQIAISAPAGGTTVTGSVYVEALASDNDRIASVQFRVNGIPLAKPVTEAVYGSVTGDVYGGETYRYIWDTTTRIDGTYVLTAVARDATGNSKTSPPVTVVVDNDNGTMLIADDFSDGMSRWEVVGGTWEVVGGQLSLPTASSAPFPNGNIILHETEVGGSYMISVDGGNKTAGGFRDFSVIFNYQDINNYYFVSYSQNVNPDPQNNGIFRFQNGVLTELADITEQVMGGQMHNLTVRRNGVEIGAYVNGVLVGYAADATFMDGRVGLGSRNDTATFDNFYVVESEYEIEDSIFPEVEVTVPADGATVGHKVNVTASAADNVAIAQVAFYLNDAPLGAPDVFAPYEALWDTRLYADGEYEIKAVATDVAGNASTSVVRVTVDNRDTSGHPRIAEYFTTDADAFAVVYDHPTLGKSNWSLYNGRYELNPAIRSGTAPNYNISVHETVLSGDFVLEVDAMNIESGNGFRDFTVFFGYQDENNHYYANFTQSAEANGIYKVVGGVPTLFTRMPHSNVPQAMQFITIERTGSIMKVYANGALVGTVADDTFGAGRVGVGSLNDTIAVDRLIAW